MSEPEQSNGQAQKYDDGIRERKAAPIDAEFQEMDELLGWRTPDPASGSAGGNSTGKDANEVAPGDENQAIQEGGSGSDSGVTGDTDGQNLEDQDETGETGEELIAAPLNGEFYDQQYSLSDDLGEITVGQAKDEVQEYRRRVNNIEKQESDILAGRNELQQLQELVRQYVPPEAVAHVEQRQQKELQRNSQRLLEIRPQWKDQLIFNEARKEIFALGVKYGFHENELGGVTDPRIIHMMDDYASRLKRERGLLKSGKKPAPKEHRSQRSGKRREGRDLDKQLAAATKSKNMDNKVAAIDQLLTE